MKNNSYLNLYLAVSELSATWWRVKVWGCDLRGVGENGGTAHMNNHCISSSSLLEVESQHVLHNAMPPSLGALYCRDRVAESMITSAGNRMPARSLHDGAREKSREHHVVVPVLTLHPAFLNTNTLLQQVLRLLTRCPLLDSG